MTRWGYGGRIVDWNPRRQHGGLKVFTHIQKKKQKQKKKKQEGQHIGATYKSILKVLLKQYRSPTDPNKFKSATIISVDHFQITMRHDLDRWPFDPKINRAHPWLMGSKCMKFHDHRLITESVIVRKPFSNNHAPWPWPLTFWPQNQ